MHLKVDTDRLTEVADELSRTASRFSGSIDALDAGSRELRSQWTGSASAAFGARAAALDADAREHITNLRRTSAVVRRLAEEYRQADSDGARAVTGR
ncbi:WXG100 family type VII secretion target [Microbacterium soli]|uniref:ESAT-6-like protein n=1 Tax=Microbacterium soli TaxID=446075 RepID=A0ABP7N7S6_9MICO